MTRLLVIPLDQVGRYRRQKAEQRRRLRALTGECRVVEFGARRGRRRSSRIEIGRRRIAGRETMQAWNHERLAGRVLEPTFELAGHEIVRGDRAARLAVIGARLRHEQVMTEGPEVERGER